MLSKTLTCPLCNRFVECAEEGWGVEVLNNLGAAVGFSFNDSVLLLALVSFRSCLITALIFVKERLVKLLSWRFTWTNIVSAALWETLVRAVTVDKTDDCDWKRTEDYLINSSYLCSPGSGCARPPWARPSATSWCEPAAAQLDWPRLRQLRLSPVWASRYASLASGPFRPFSSECRRELAPLSCPIFHCKTQWIVW